MHTTIIRAALATMLATLPAAAMAGGDPAAGQDKAQVCAPCHGTDGNSENPQYPKIAGQHSDYIVQALSDYKSGARSNPIMTGFVANLTRQDMEDLAAYFSVQSGDLFTPTSF